MAEEKLLTIRDVSLILGISEKDVIGLAETGKIPAYKIGGVYLRFKHDQVAAYRKKIQGGTSLAASLQKYSIRDRVFDFFYFNDFYILALLLVVLLVIIILKGF